MQKGIKIRLYPNKRQIDTLNKIFGHTRYVYNYFLNYSKENKDYSYANWSKKFTILKTNTEANFLKEADKFALQNALKNLKQAYDNFFSKRNKAPVFKKNIMNNLIKLTIQIPILYFMEKESNYLSLE